MIFSASRRTDIPAYYSDWLLGRLQAGEVLVRNPMQQRQVARIPLTQSTIDGLVLWTKNPLPLLPKLATLANYPYYVQFTLTAYGADVEPFLPPKDVLLSAFQKLARESGENRVLWRYDPIIYNKRYTKEEHIRIFQKYAQSLSGYTDVCTVSFLDVYRKIQKNLQQIGVTFPSREEKIELLVTLAAIAKEAGMALFTCAEDLGDLSGYGVAPAACIDAERIVRISGKQMKAKRDTNQRTNCCCAQSIDIGAYDSCQNGCLYCYANVNRTRVLANAAAHNPASPLLFGTLHEGDQVYNREI